MAETTESAPDVTEGAPADAPPGGDKGDQGKTFTQADIDRVVEQRLSRERAKFADYDQIKADAAELAKIRDGEKTELQKFQEQLANEQTARQTAESERDTLKRTQYGIDKGLPPALAKRLTAQAEADLDVEIEELKPFIPGAAKPDPPRRVGGGAGGSFKSGATGAEAEKRDPKAVAAEALRRLQNRD